VHADDLFVRDGKQAERIRLAKVVLGRERQFPNVVEGLDRVGGTYSRFSQPALVKIGLERLFDLAAEAMELYPLDLGAGGGFYCFIPEGN